MIAGNKIANIPSFITIVCVINNKCTFLNETFRSLSNLLSENFQDYEINIIENTTDETNNVQLHEMVSLNGIPNLQVHMLTQIVDQDLATWIGIENSLGDVVVVVDPFLDDISFIPDILAKSAEGFDVVFASNSIKPNHSILFKFLFLVFNFIYSKFCGIHLENDAPRYRALSRRVVNYIRQFHKPCLAYRRLPVNGGFKKAKLNYSFQPKLVHRKSILSDIDRGLRLLVTSTKKPLRLVTAISLFGACANILYCLYIVYISFFKSSIAQGWISISLQLSGMFFLLSVVLAVLSEYIINAINPSDDKYLYHVNSELTSSKIIRKLKLNIEEVSSSKIPDQDTKESLEYVRL